MSTQVPPTPSQTSAPPTTSDVFPSAILREQAFRLSMAQDKPILTDYYLDTATDKAFMGEDTTTGEKWLVKSAVEFTSQIQKAYKIGTEYIIMTENSIYVVHGNMKKKRIQASALQQDS